MKIGIEQIKPSPDNAGGRSEMNEAMEELISTIKAIGVVEPITVFPNDGGYEIIEGERRFYASQQAGLKEVDVYVREVTAEDARLMRLASLTNANWAYEEFAQNVWRELEDRDIGYKKLSSLTGLLPMRIKRAVDFVTGQSEGAVVIIDDEIMARATGIIQSKLSESVGVTMVTRKAVANKCSEEELTFANTDKFCSRVKKALDNVVAFGDPEDEVYKDYEEHNFELEAVLKIPFAADKQYEKEVEMLAIGKESESLSEWESNRLKEAEVARFVKDVGLWESALADILIVKKKLTFEHSQFINTKLEKQAEMLKELQEALNTAIAERKM